MKAKNILPAVIFILLLSVLSFAQQTKNFGKAQTSQGSSALSVRSTPAYAEILLRKTDLEADLEDLLVNYKDDYPKVKSTRYELDSINASLNKILAVNISDSSKLTLALGKLLVRRAELATDLWSLKSRLGDEHPDVKRAERKVAVFDKAINEILP